MTSKKKEMIHKNLVHNNHEYVSDTSSSRIISFIIDWILGGICSGIPSVIFYLILTGKSKPLTSMYQFGAAGFGGITTVLIALLCIAFGIFYYVIIPWKIYPGQTIGKKMTHLKIVSTQDKELGLNTYLMRQFVFMVLVEGAATPVSTYIKVIITTMTRFYVDSYLGLIWDIITLISVFMLFWGKQRISIHDYVIKTKVIKISNN